jgi:DNA-binding NtrC family response regulator
MVDAMVAPATASAADGGLDYYAATARFQADLIKQTLIACNGNVARSAQRLGLSRHALRHQMTKLGLASD